MRAGPRRAPLGWGGRRRGERAGGTGRMLLGWAGAGGREGRTPGPPDPPSCGERAAEFRAGMEGAPGAVPAPRAPLPAR